MTRPLAFPMLRTAMLTIVLVAGLGSVAFAEPVAANTPGKSVKLSKTLTARFVTQSTIPSTQAATNVVMGRLPQVESSQADPFAQSADAAGNALVVVATSPKPKAQKTSHKKRYKKRTKRVYSSSGYRHTHRRTPRHASSWHINPRRGGTFSGH
ncbi:hypothetical protein [Tropicimonas sp. S265A]|uniref:hypothetical protein n=1 Tax=Tropicimonas sp. S265A TaxID=3415134 RepID=UPI003C79D106